MIAAEDALHAVLGHGRQLEATPVALPAALGLVLRDDVRATADAPPFDASAMDGYAARRADLAQPLRVAGTIAAGAAPTGTVAAGTCVRIFTGAPVPPGADCVVKQEDTAREGDTLRVLRADTPSHIRRRGDNRRAGELIVPAGTRLGPAELAALAAAGVTQPAVTRRPRCVHLVTGNEIVPHTQTPVGAQVRDSNSTLVAALVARHGAELAGHAHAPDELAEARARVAAFPEFDVLLVSGGASVGDHDLARPLFRELGFTLHFEQVNLRPGKPLVFASRDAQLAFALPGNPVSHWVTFHLFVAPLLEQLQTGQRPELPRQHGRLATNAVLPPPDARRTFWPCRARLVAGQPELTPLALASSGDAAGLAGANALLPLPANSLDPTGLVEFIPCT